MIYLNNIGVKGDWARAIKWVAVAAGSLFLVNKLVEGYAYLNTDKGEQAKEYVMNADPARYNRIVNSHEYQNMPTPQKTFFWPQEAKRVEDSIKISGNAAKAYVEAMQMNNW